MVVSFKHVICEPGDSTRYEFTMFKKSDAEGGEVVVCRVSDENPATIRFTKTELLEARDELPYLLVPRKEYSILNHDAVGHSLIKYTAQSIGQNPWTVLPALRSAVEWMNEM